MAEGVGRLAGAGGVAEQLVVWEVLGAIVSTVLGPVLQDLTREVNKALPSTPLSAAQLADMVVRNIVEHAAAAAYARESGITEGDFRRMVQSAGDAPSPTELVLALRRGLIPRDGIGPDVVSFQQGIAEGRTYNKYTSMLERLGEVPIPPSDAVDAVVESQITREQGEAIAFLSGVSKADFEILVNTRGRPPSPTELNELHRRGLIPLEGTGPTETTVQQGIYEGATKNKWWRLLADLGDYVPPPRTVTALVREGSLTDEQALRLYRAAGLSEELAATYLTSAHHQKLAATRDLAKGDIEHLYGARIISRDQATEALGLLNYTAEESAEILAYVDMRRTIAALDQAVSRVRAQYVARHIDRAAAVGALGALNVVDSQQQELLRLWDIERAVNVKTISAAEIASAYHFKILDQATATMLLVADGWSERDAWILLSVREHAEQPNRPPGVGAPAGG